MVAVPLYARRYVINAAEIVAWYRAQGLATTVPPEEMHVTVVYSRTPFASIDFESTYPEDSLFSTRVIASGGRRSTKMLGPAQDAMVLCLECLQLTRDWLWHRELGASWDWDYYQPHVTISYQTEGVDPAAVAPFPGDVILGGVVYSALDENWRAGLVEKSMRSGLDLASSLASSSSGLVSVEKTDAGPRFCEKIDLLADTSRAILDTMTDSSVEKRSSVSIAKTDDEQRIVWGWVSVSTENGERVFDGEGHHIPVEELAKASYDFMSSVRVGKTEHRGEQTSEVVGMLPLSAELAKSLGIETNREGLIAGFRILDDEVWCMVKSGELPAFSIAGVGDLHDAA